MARLMKTEEGEAMLYLFVYFLEGQRARGGREGAEGEERGKILNRVHTQCRVLTQGSIPRP